MAEVRSGSDYPIRETPLTTEDCRDLVKRLLAASADLNSLAMDDTFRFQSLTGSVARLVHDWCVIVADEFEDDPA